MTDNSRPPDWAVARAFWEAVERYDDRIFPWGIMSMRIKNRAETFKETDEKSVRLVEVKE
jgi:hypothetical protein